MNVSGNTLTRFADVSLISGETGARKNSSQKALAKVESNLET